MRTQLILFCLLFSHVFAMASELEAGKGQIKGKVLDQSSQSPIPYASVALISNPDSSIIAGVITNNDGSFELMNIPYGEYNLKVSFVGYSTKVIEHVEVSRKSKAVELAPTHLNESVTKLDEAVISHERIKGEEKIDRTVFTINDDLRKASSSGLDMLKHIPSVTVDFQENVTVEGSSNIEFYVDGVLRNKDFVAQIDPLSIDKIEVVSNPGVKYDANISAVLNIVLKKEKRYGFTGLVNMQIPNPNVILWNPRANLEFGTQKFRVYVGNRTHIEKFDGYQNYKMVQNIDNNEITQIKNGTGENQWSNNYLNYGIDFFLSEKTSLNFYGDWRHHYSDTKDFLFENEVYHNNDLTSFMEINQNNTNQGNSNYYSLFGKHKLDDEGSELTMEGSYYTYSSLEENYYDDIYYNLPDLSEDFVIHRAEYNENSRQAVEFKSDLSRVNKKIKHELGYHLYDQWMNNSFETESEPAPGYFKYNELRHAGYYSVTSKFKNLNWQLGVRAEYSIVDIEEEKEIRYGAFVPNFSLNYQLPNKHSVKLTFNRRIDRPSIGDLNPFEKFYDSLHIRKGNPDLKPAFHNKLELSYNASINNNYISPKIFAEYTQNGFQEIKQNNDDGIVQYFMDNVGEAWEYGGAVSFSWQLTKWLRINGYSKLYNQIYFSDHDFTLSDKREKLSFDVNATTIFSLPKDFALFAMVQRRGNNISYSSNHSRGLLPLIGVEKEVIKNGKLEIFYIPFIKKYTYSEVTTRTEGLYESWEGRLRVPHTFAVSFTYRFNHGKKVNKINRSTDYEKDSNGGGL